MKTPTMRSPADPTEALLQGLIAECHAVIRDTVLPGIKDTKDHGYRRYYINSVTDMIGSAVKLSDAIGRLRGTAPQDEIRQRITVERIQRLSPPQGEGG